MKSIKACVIRMRCSPAKSWGIWMATVSSRAGDARWRRRQGHHRHCEAAAQDALHPQLGNCLPQPLAAKVVNDISYPHDHTPAHTVLMVDQLSPDQNSDWFRSRLIANGWKDANANGCAHSAAACVMQFERGKSRMMFVAEQTGDARKC